ncbi:MAG: internalization-related competence protein ComEC/Rec2 [Acidobacteriaceae bacterium]|nr:internalization-related competence protein ComEC/Rec2 [Acidobacteriaceae bacterium]
MRSAGRASTTEWKDSPNPELWARGSVRVEPLEFRRVPLLAAAICFALGEVAARNGRPAVLLLIALVVLAGLVLLALRSGLRVVLVPLAGVWMLVGMGSAGVQPVPEQQSSLIHYADGLSRAVRGHVVRVRPLAARVAADQDSDTTQFQEAEAPAAMSIDVAVDAVEDVTPDIARMVTVQGGVRVTVMAQGKTLPELRCGDGIEAPMQMRVPERYRDPGAWQYADYLLAQGIGVHANVRVAMLKRIERGAASLQCRIYAAQSWAAGRMDGFVASVANRSLPQGMRLSSDDAGMLKAMLFGDRAGLTQTQRIGFQRTGSFHLFVVSGMHVTLLAGAVFWMARRLRLREWLATWLTLGLATLYAVLTGFGAPVQRALWMTALFLVARLLSRDRNVLNGLGAAALGVLVWSPGALFESSFQMTFLAVMAIGGIAVPLGERSLIPYGRAGRGLRDEWLDSRMEPRVAQFRVMLRLWGEGLAAVLGRWAYWVPVVLVRCGIWIAELAMLGLVVEMVMVLPMAVYFHRATPFALPANMLSVPMVAVLAPMGVLTFATSLVSSWVAVLPGAVTALLLHGVRGTVGAMSHVRVADVRVPAPMDWVMVAAVLAWAGCCWAVRRRGWSWVVVAMLPLVAVLVLWPEAAVMSPGMLEVTAIDVGQGDSLLVVSPEGQTMLVDAGGPVGGVKEAAEAQAAFDVGEEVVSPYLWSRRIRRLDVMVLSHAHSDHMGGMAAVMRSFRPRELWVGVDADSVAYRALLAEAAELGVAVRRYRAEDAMRWSGVDVKVLSPTFEYAHAGDPQNDDSLVLRLEYGKASVLLEGDAEAASEREMVAHGALAPVTLLKVGHHGSRSSTTAEFLAAVAPRDAVVSVGQNNAFGHPRFEVIERLALAHTRLYRTDEFGLVTFLLDEKGGIRELSR